ncbi:septal ring lytic transglycosylase RlpA family protein [Vibrio mexicanus]|uniref:septal ring lytic transglycosylase RlpA family protein n=1 Tax=Vibrio mexicanus TaxID=1004326 RepID=UPI00063C051B|nr:septal ring lytic transglycosylase RlpA family protein [Vibrio mexicanus]
MTRHFLLLIASLLVLAGCSSSDSRYSLSDDTAPSEPISVEHIEDAIPQYEPYSLGGNSNYTLRGEHYTIIRDAKGFTQSGKASWYGKKFHGHLTSNGEIYDMYSMTAAHKTLPIPSYVKVTNKDNGKTTVVRVNDRGPFHEGRIIDLSYAAAYKLDVVKTGTANVEIEVITVERPTGENKKNSFPSYVIQVASSQHEDRVRTLAEDLSQNLSVESFINSSESIHQVMLGPFTDYKLTQDTLDKVKLLGHSTAFIRKQTVTH